MQHQVKTNAAFKEKDIRLLAEKLQRVSLL